MIVTYDLMLLLKIIVPVSFIGGFAYWLIDQIVNDQEHWHHTIDTKPFSAEDYYRLLSAVLKNIT